jgi:hypothetical protein
MTYFTVGPGVELQMAPVLVFSAEACEGLGAYRVQVLVHHRGALHPLHGQGHAEPVYTAAAAAAAAAAVAISSRRVEQLDRY